jgi:hypothetical protein
VKDCDGNEPGNRLIQTGADRDRVESLSGENCDSCSPKRDNRLGKGKGCFPSGEMVTERAEHILSDFCCSIVKSTASPLTETVAPRVQASSSQINGANSFQP